MEIVATEGTAEILQRNGVPARVTRKQFEGVGPGGEPTAVDLINAGELTWSLTPRMALALEEMDMKFTPPRFLVEFHASQWCKGWLQ
ncbi:MAG: hypothetical protein OSA11_02890 [Candidatus Nanopelagicales bacterium]|nr:hypothetical protein [Candidatus Nanopelagicales bacterium]